MNRAADIRPFVAAAALILIELAASVVALAIIEQRNRVKVLKGGI